MTDTEKILEYIKSHEEDDIDIAHGTEIPLYECLMILGSLKREGKIKRVNRWDSYYYEVI